MSPVPVALRVKILDMRGRATVDRKVKSRSAILMHALFDYFMAFPFISYYTRLFY